MGNVMVASLGNHSARVFRILHSRSKLTVWPLLVIMVVAGTIVTVLAVGPVTRSLTTSSGYSPSIIQTAYGFEPLLKRGIEGQGETVLLPEIAQFGPDSLSGSSSSIREDMARFDSLFGLPDVNLHVDTAITGSSLAGNASDEEVEDVEVLHAIAPKAKIEVLLVPSSAGNSGTDFTNAIVETVKAAIHIRASVISLSDSWGEDYISKSEAAVMHSALRTARDDDITFISAAGDSGALSLNGPPQEVSLPASDPLVLGVGGTTLSADPTTGRYLGEVAWSEPNEENATGGGFSQIFRRPAYQNSVPGIGTMRGVPDVSADAGYATGMTTVIADGQNYTTNVAGGTSASTPLWAGLVALADQIAGRHLGFVNAGLYRIAEGSSYGAAFHDVTTGDNTVITSTGTVDGYDASVGWDPVTGWGSPDAQILVPLLAKAVRRGDGVGL
jgi:subtilase family serine protease